MQVRIMLLHVNTFFLNFRMTDCMNMLVNNMRKQWMKEFSGGPC